MSSLIPSPIMTVKLREATVALLMAQRGDNQETIDAVVARLARAAAQAEAPPTVTLPAAPRLAPRGRNRRENSNKWALILLGETLRTNTLGEMFAKVVDALAAVDPASLERLSKMRSRKRAYVSKNCESIHPGRPDLQVRRSSSGWWVSANIGTNDIERALRATCESSGLSYGRDVIFIGRNDPELQ